MAIIFNNIDNTKTIKKDRKTGEIKYNRKQVSYGLKFDFIGAIIIVLFAFFIFVGALGAYKYKDNPISFVRNVADIISDYGSSLTDNVRNTSRFFDGVINGDPDVVNFTIGGWNFHLDADKPIFSYILNPFNIFGSDAGGVIFSFVKKLFVPFVFFTTFGLGFVVMVFRIIGVCLL